MLDFDLCRHEPYYVRSARGSFQHRLLNEEGVSRVEAFFTIAVSSFGDGTPKSVQLARVLCLSSEAVYTHCFRPLAPRRSRNINHIFGFAPGLQ
jgi:hypothetical protein